jgi:hypothetical protein
MGFGAPCPGIHQKDVKKRPQAFSENVICCQLKWQSLVQAMKTAMKASKKIRTAPPTGRTMGIKGTMDSTTSVESEA